MNKVITVILGIFGAIVVGYLILKYIFKISFPVLSPAPAPATTGNSLFSQVATAGGMALGGGGLLGSLFSGNAGAGTAYPSYAASTDDSDDFGDMTDDYDLSGDDGSDDFGDD